ncbi:MAG: alginate export family protein [Nitrospinaceae bacterium]
MAILVFLLLPIQVLKAENLVGKRFKITGQWSESGLTANRLQNKDPRKDPDTGWVIGRVENLDRKNHFLNIGPFHIRWDTSTRSQKIHPADLKAGLIVKIKFRIESKNKFLALLFRSGPSSLPANQVKIIGTVMRMKPLPDGSTQVIVFGLPVTIPKDARREAVFLTRRPDDKRPDTQYSFPVLGQPLTIGGEYELKTRWKEDPKLNASPDDLLELNQKLQLEFFYPATHSISFFFAVDVIGETELHAEDNLEESDAGLKRRETWVFANNLLDSDFSLQVGRIDIVEPREWWWDEDLDSVRLFYNNFPFYFQIALAKELGQNNTTQSSIDPEDEQIIRFLGQLGMVWTKNNRIEFFFLTQNDVSNTASLGDTLKTSDKDASDAQLTWLGLRAIGKARKFPAGRLTYWFDSALVWGQESLLKFATVNSDLSSVSSLVERDIFGWAFDLGFTWTPPVKGKPTLTFGYAVGSGDRNERNSKDNAFRQTGLQDNNNKFRGVDRFRYYGELFRPELSNMYILTAAAGIRILPNSSVELLYHNYHQVKAAPFLRSAGIKTSPLGTDRDLGNELDLVIGLEEWRHVELEIVNAWFWAGDAFGTRSGELAFQSEFKFNYNF